MDSLTLSLEDLFTEISERARTEGAFSLEEWNDSVDELLEEKREVMKIDDDDDFQYMTEALQARYDQFIQDVGRM